MIELLDITCGDYLKNESELKNETYGVMRPIVMLQAEKDEHEIKKLIEKYCSFVLKCQEMKENIHFFSGRSGSRGEYGEILDAER